MSATARPLPQVSPESEPFWAGCREGRLLLQHCNRCGKINWFPRRYCAYCASEDFSWREAAGTGVLETYSIVHRAMSEAWQSEVPYILAIVRLSEGIRMVTRLVRPDASHVPAVDAPVQVRFVDVGEGWRFPFFEEIS